MPDLARIIARVERDQRRTGGLEMALIFAALVAPFAVKLAILGPS